MVGKFDYRHKRRDCCSRKKHCNCNTCKPVDCCQVLEEYHKLIEEANRLFDKADRVQVENLYSLLDNLLDLEQSLEWYKSGKHKVINGEKLLDCSDCRFDCKKNCCKCRELKREAICLYGNKEKEMLEAIYLLKKLICTLKSAINKGKEGDKVYEDYIKCIHC